MSADANGNDLSSVAVPVTGFIAVQMSGTPAYVESAAGGLTPLVLPTGYKKVGLLTDDGAPQDDSDSDDDIELWQKGYKLRGDVTSRTLEITTAELNDTVRELINGVEPDANGMITVDQGNENQFPLFEYVKYKNGMSLRRNGLAQISTVKPAQQTRGDVAGYDITFEWISDETVGGFYREWVVNPSTSSVSSLAIKATDGSAAPSSVAVGSTVALKAVATLTDSTTIDVSATWASSDATKATVSDGTVTGVAAGTATITASYAGVSASLSITVAEA
jgi:uncharacterized protein YjdB